jgi:murein tripeptide amidase MpaA
MPHIEFDRYYRYDELTRLLLAYEAEYPELVTLESLGKSYEGRDIWLLTVTNFATGQGVDKPAVWVDGNIHASETSASTACLYLLETLVTQYALDENITRCLDSRVFYICPRVNPDGAEWALADKPRIIRSSTRPYPYDEEPLGGLERQDIDGDGRALQMRVPDPHGQWKIHPQNSRLMVRRDPTEVGGEYYRVLPEGLIDNHDGVTIDLKPRKQGLDLNRNFPFEWRQLQEQPGAGPYPASEPEVRAMVAFIAAHNNIVNAVTFHTYSGVLLRPFGTHPDDYFPAEDLWTFQRIGQQGTALTGYPAVSVYHDFRYHPKETITGVFDDWIYDHFGVYAWTVEIWSPQRQAGIESYKFIDWYREHPIEDDFKLLKWSDQVLEGKGYIDWYPFQHPQLGPVELGGWDYAYCWRNPPPAFLEKEVAKFPQWVIWQALITPRLELHSLKTTPLADGHYHIQMVVQNTGWLPSYVSKKALDKKVVRGVVAEIDLPDGATLKTGKLRMEIGQLEGWHTLGPAISAGEDSGVTSNRAKVEWVIQAPVGGFVKLKARHDRAGVVETEVILG